MNETIDWEPLRCGAKPRKDELYLSVRKASLKLSPGFVSSAEVMENRYRYVLAKKCEPHFLLQLTFLTETEGSELTAGNPYLDGLYQLVGDGGGRIERPLHSKSGLILNCSSAIKNSEWLIKVAEDPNVRRRRFVPERTRNPHVWTVRVIPGFNKRKEAVAVGPDTFDDHTGGIYRYVDTKGDVLYIGQGLIGSRHRSHLKEKSMDAEALEWTVVNDPAFRRHAESHHLASHRARHGRLPPWNRRMGGSLL